MINRTRYWLLLVIVLMFTKAGASRLSDVQIFNGNSKARITFSFIDNPEYTFSQIDDHRITLDIKKINVIQGLPVKFSRTHLVKSICLGTSKDTKSLQLVINLTKNGTVKAVKKKNGVAYTVILIINADIQPLLPSVITDRVKESIHTTHLHKPFQNSFKSQNNHITNIINRNMVTHLTSSLRCSESFDGDKVVIAIDAGHGGQDPGAIGQGGTREKNVTIAIGQKLRLLLDGDSMFKGVMTRDGDYFISVIGRSDVARKQNANFLVSIHADATPNRNVTGASVWVLSNRRANSEMANWLEEYEKQSELLGGAGDVLPISQSDPYLSQTVLGLEFEYSQRVGYDVAISVLNWLKNTGSLHKFRPERASLGILRSPDIPSILVETGFISNDSEERLLINERHQQEIAKAIYQGIRNYFIAQHVPRCSLPQKFVKDTRPARIFRVK